MNVVLTGIFYPMAILRYFERALVRRDDVSLFTAGPYTGTWIPWNGGMNLPSKYAGAPDLALPQAAIGMGVSASVVEAKLPWIPDLWLQVDAGWHLVSKPKDGLNVIIGTDPHVLDYEQPRMLTDVFYSMQLAYMKPGDRCLPYAYDPEVHYPEDVPCEQDVVCIGLQYKNRQDVMAVLSRMGYNTRLETGPAFDEYRRAVCSAPIGFSWSSRQDLVARVFELLAMRRLAVVNWVPFLDQYFTTGEHLVSFSSVDEAVAHVSYYLDHPGEMETIRDAGRLAVLPHTYDARIDQLLADVTGG